MIDINISLRKAYYDALGGASGLNGVKVFTETVPQQFTGQNYILCRSIYSTGASTNNTSDTNTNIVVEIHTFNDGTNSGLSCDIVARDVFNRVLPNPQAVLTMDGAQMVTTKLLSDTKQDFTMQGNRGYMSRFLTFGHYIYHRSDIS